MDKTSKLRYLLITLIILSMSYCATAARYLEKLDRGVVAVHQNDDQVYIGWRLLGTDSDTIKFNVYRDDTMINMAPISDSTNFTDKDGSISSTYRVVPVIDGKEQESSAPASVWQQQYLTIPLKVPEATEAPAGETGRRRWGGRSGYSPNDASVGDLDGDGQYEIVLKWDPFNAKDNSHSGSTGNVYLDAYEMDGTFLWRIDLGMNIRAGAHYTQFMVYDFDCDGRAEIACKTAPYTVDGKGNNVLLDGDTLTDYRNSRGYILSGPEYLTVFDGRTGAAIANTKYYPDRVDISQWGDDYGNRGDRFLAGVAYLDGQRPSLIMARGYYAPQGGYSARNEITAWDLRDGKLTRRWWFKAGQGINDNINREYIGQGNHSLSIADVDSDGKDEIVYGACVIDDDGTGLYSTGLEHGDALHVSDLDPSRPGLEVFGIHEGGRTPGAALLNARTGEVIWATVNADTGRGLVADVDPAYPGAECFGGPGGSRNIKGETIQVRGGNNFANWWDGDLLREILNSNTISKWNWETGEMDRIFTADGCSSNNGSKSTPCLSADILGDWREEVIWRTRDNQSLRIYTTIIPTDYRITTLMHDAQYREAIAWQNVGYNQPPHPSFYLGAEMFDKSIEEEPSSMKNDNAN